MRQIRNFGFVPHFQELNVSDAPFESSRYRQHARFAKGDEPLVRHPRHSATHRGRSLGATFLSGTVVVNALTELYVMFKYLRPQELQSQQISCFDAWAAIFTQKSADYELNVTGKVKRKERFRTYIKVPELAMFLRELRITALPT